MGRAIIISELGSGEYVVREIFDVARIESRLVIVTDEIAELERSMNVLSADILALENERQALIYDMNAAIDDANDNASSNEAFAASYALIVDKATAEITEINRQLVEKSTDNSRAAFKRASNLLLKNEIDEAISKYSNAQPVPAWCADYSVGLSGEVGTVQINDESNAPNDQPLIIKPAGPDGDLAVWGESDKTTQPAISSGASAVVYNSIVLPAVQKWMPKYRAGVLSDINHTLNMCAVSFAGEVKNSSIEPYGFAGGPYNIFISESLTGVSFDYLSCNSKAFKEGDSAVIKFDPDGVDVLATAEVIGFIDNPKRCDQDMFMRHYDGVSNFGAIYKYRADGSPPTLEYNYPPRELGLGVIVNGGIHDIYCGSNGHVVGALSAIEGAVYKNDSLIVNSTGESNYVSANSMYVITQDLNYTVRLYNYDGVLQKTFELPTINAAQVMHFSNNHGILYHSVGESASDDGISVADFSGNLILRVPKTFTGELHYLCGASESAFFIVDTDSDFANNIISVYSKSGALAGTYIFANKYFVDPDNAESCIGYSDTHMYVFYASKIQAYCDIYEHTLTIDSAGEVTNAALGAKIFTVNSPTDNNMNWLTWQAATIAYTRT